MSREESPWSPADAPIEIPENKTRAFPGSQTTHPISSVADEMSEAGDSVALRSDSLAYIIDELVHRVIKLRDQSHRLCDCVRISSVMCLMQVGQVREIVRD